jgi:hypothetical protein
MPVFHDVGLRDLPQRRSSAIPPYPTTSFHDITMNLHCAFVKSAQRVVTPPIRLSVYIPICLVAFLCNLQPAEASAS